MKHSPLPQPIAPEPERVGGIFRIFARISWMSALFGLILFFGALANQAEVSQRAGLGTLSGFLTSTGILSGLMALLGIFRHGRRHILLPALAGLCVWALMISVLNPMLGRIRQRVLAGKPPTPMSALQARPGATRIVDTARGFSIDVPREFTAIPKQFTPKDCLHAYSLPPREGEALEVFLIKSMTAPLERTRIQAAKLQKGIQASVTTVLWRGIEIDAIVIPSVANNKPCVTYSVQVPLLPTAIQIAFGGPGGADLLIRERIQECLSSLEGKSNW